MLHSPVPDSWLAHALAAHAAFRYPIPSIADMRRLAWRVAFMRQSSAMELALSENIIFLADFIEQQNEVIRDLRQQQASEETHLAQRELGT